MRSPSTLIFHTGALGDGVLIWPLLRALSPLTLVGSGEKARLAARWLEAVTPIDGDAPDFSRLFVPAAGHEVADRVRDLLAAARRIVSFISDGVDVWADHVRSLAPDAAHCFVRSRPPHDPRLHVADFHQLQLARAGLPIAPVQPALRRNIDASPVLHPGSGGAAKCWPAERFTQLAEHLQRIGRPPVLLLGPVERDRFDPALITAWRRDFEVAEPADLLELSERIARAAVFIGNDSGPTHLAAQLGVPTIGLFGPTDPRVWSPRGPCVRVLAPPQPSPMTWLEVQTVAQAVAPW